MIFPQLTLVGVAVIIALTKWFKLFRGVLFYVLVIVIGGLIMIFPVQHNVALVILVQFVFGDWERVSILPNLT